MIVKITAQTDMYDPHNMAMFLRILDDSGESAHVRNPKAVEEENRNKNVCLNCTKKRCTGSALCFRKERDKRR